MGIRFDEERTHTVDRAVHCFRAYVDGQVVRCGVTEEAFFFGFNVPHELIPMPETFEKYRDSIQRAARRIIEEGRFEPDGSVLVRDRDV